MSDDSLSRFAVALQNLLDAARNYLGTQKTEDDLGRIQSLFTEVQIAAPPNVTIPPFRRELWPLEIVEYVRASTDNGKTWQPWPQYRTLQRGNSMERSRWMAELGGIVAAVFRQIELQAVLGSTSSVTSPPGSRTRLGRRAPNDELLDFDESERKKNPNLTDKEVLSDFRKKHHDHPIFESDDPHAALRAARSRRKKKRPPA